MCDSAMVSSQRNASLRCCWIIYTNSKGVENLSIKQTAEQPKQQQSEQQNFYQNQSQNSINSLQDIDSDSSLDYDSMHLMLDPHLRPATPDANSAISQRIYNEHKQMAQEYLKVQTEIAYTSRHKEQLLAKMTPEQRKERLEICSYLKDTADYVKLEENLKRQLELIRRDPQQQQQQQQQQNSPTVPQVNPRDEDGWILIGQKQQ